MEMRRMSEWSIHPNIAEMLSMSWLGATVWKTMPTRYEGDVLYYKL